MTDPLLPSDEAAEQHLVACALIPGSTDPVIAIAAERGVTPAHFHFDKYRYVWEAIVELRNREPAPEPDFAALAALLRAHERLDSIGGPGALTALYTHIGTAHGTRQYIEQIIESWQRRTLILRCQDAIAIARAGSAVGEATIPLIESLQADLADISAVANASTSFTPYQTILKQALADLYARYKMRGRFSGINTGIADLDRMTDGLGKDQMIVVGARPSMGKTAIAMQWGLHAAMRNTYSHDPEDWKKERIPVAVFSVEMSELLLGQRLLAQTAGISVKSFASGFLSRKQMDETQNAIIQQLEQLEKDPITFIVDDTSDITIEQLEARARYAVKKWGVKLIIVDYAQLLTSSAKKAQRSQVEELNVVSVGLKRISRKLQIPLVVCVQLNREVDERPGHVPLPSDLKGCGQLEQDADLIIFPVRPEYYYKDAAARVRGMDKYGFKDIDLEAPQNRNFLARCFTQVEHMTEDERREFLFDAYAEVYIGKQRGGATGCIKTYYHKERCWFYGWTEKPFSNNPAERQQNLDENHGA